VVTVSRPPVGTSVAHPASVGLVPHHGGLGPGSALDDVRQVDRPGKTIEPRTADRRTSAKARWRSNRTASLSWTARRGPSRARAGHRGALVKAPGALVLADWTVRGPTVLRLVPVLGPFPAPIAPARAHAREVVEVARSFRSVGPAAAGGFSHAPRPVWAGPSRLSRLPRHRSLWCGAHLSCPAPPVVLLQERDCRHGRLSPSGRWPFGQGLDVRPPGPGARSGRIWTRPGHPDAGPRGHGRGSRLRRTGAPDPRVRVPHHADYEPGAPRPGHPGGYPLPAAHPQPPRSDPRAPHSHHRHRPRPAEAAEDVGRPGWLRGQGCGRLCRQIT